MKIPIQNVMTFYLLYSGYNNRIENEKRKMLYLYLSVDTQLVIAFPLRRKILPQEKEDNSWDFPFNKM